MMNIKTQVKTIQILTFVLTFLGINTIFSQILISPNNGATCISTTSTLTWNGTLGNTTVEILECNSTIGSILSGYTYQNTFYLDMNPINPEDDLSGITYNPITNTLFAVANGGNAGSLFEAIYEVDLNGNIINSFNLVDTDDGISATEYFEDTEGIVHLYDRTFAVVEEYDGRIAIITLPVTSANIYHSDANIIQLPGDWKDNNGLEGISYDPIANQLHISKEKLIREYYVVDIPAIFPVSPTQVAYTTHNILPIDIDEAAGTHYMGLTARFANTDIANHRLIVDEKGPKIVEIDANYNIVDELWLPAEKYEGVTMDNNGTLYMVQEPNAIHVYTNPNPPGVIHSATVSGNTYTVPAGILDGETEYCWRIINNGNVSPTYSFTTIAAMTVCTSISSSENDVEEQQNGSIYDGSTDLEFIYDPNRGEQKVWLRFEDLGIPQGATITGAYMQFTADEASSAPVDLTIRGELTDNALPFTFGSGNLSLRPVTQTEVIWSPEAWAVGERGIKQRTPDLKTIFQEIINNNGFNENSAIALVISGSGIDKRVAESYEGAQIHGSPEFAPELCVTFTLETCDTIIPIETNISLWLEGSFNPVSNTMQVSTEYLNVLPTEQPYFDTIWNYNGTESVDTHAADVVDWILVSFRSDSLADSEVFKAAAFLHTDGSVRFLEGYGPPESLIGDAFYIVIDHRNHMVVMSHEAVPIQLVTTTNDDQYGYINYDFRQQNSYTGSGFGQKQLPNGVWASFAGDMDGNYDINGSDNGIRFGQNGIFRQYIEGDLNLDGDVNGVDRALWSPNSGHASGVPQLLEEGS